jgi:hypothetical protein
MGSKFTGKVIISLIIAFVLLLPAVSHAQQKQRIKVIVRNASIRLQPNVDSEVILSPPTGSTFEVEKKVGEWYEIKFTSELGVLITGYIHSMFVDVIAAEPEPEPEVVQEPVQRRAQPRPRRARPRGSLSKFNISLGAFFSPAHVMYDTYEDPWSLDYLGEFLYVYDYMESPYATGFTAGFGIFVMPRVEFFGSFASASGNPWWEMRLEVPSPYFFDDPRWDDIDSDAFSDEEQLTYKQNILSFGLNLYLMRTGKWSLYIGGGGSYIMTTVELLYDVSFTHNWYPGPQDHDVVIDSVTFEETKINTFGFNFKFGAELRISRNIFLFLEGMYISAKDDVPYPLDPNTLISMDLGGGSSALGIKFHF